MSEQKFQTWLTSEEGQAAANLNDAWKYRISLNDLTQLQPAINEALAQAFEAGHQSAGT